MKKIIINTIFVIYLILTVLVTTVLLSFNDKNIAEFDKNYIITIKDNNNYNSNDLIIVKKTNQIKEGENVFYYNNKKVNVNKVKQINDDIIVLENNRTINDDEILGKKSKTIPLLGLIYNTVTSRKGYLIIIILPMLIAFIYEIYAITKELKKK